MTDEHYVILKEYVCVYFAGYYTVDYLCLTGDMVLTYILYSVGRTNIYIVQFTLNFL